nr:MAG TPA: hypothetical protein [Caudoviricetes sp.]
MKSREKYSACYGEIHYYIFGGIIMIDKEKVRELTNKYVVEKDLGDRMLTLISGVMINIITDYYGYDSVEDLIENDKVPDEEFDVFLDVVKDCLNKEVMEALS